MNKLSATDYSIFTNLPTFLYYLPTFARANQTLPNNAFLFRYFLLKELKSVNILHPGVPGKTKGWL